MSASGSHGVNARSFRERMLAAVAVFLLAFLAYVNTLGNDFVWDDEYLILHNPYVKSFSHIGRTFTTHLGYGSGNVNNFYRPVQELSNMVDYFLWGEDPVGFHLTNVLLHALVAVMVFFLLFMILNDLMAAVIAAVFYAVHPIHTQAVAYIAGRAEPLYALFWSASFICFIVFTRMRIRGRPGAGYYCASLILFFLALLSKEMALTLPLMLFLYLFFFFRRTPLQREYRRLKWSWAPFAGIVGIYGWLRSFALSSVPPAPQSRLAAIPFLQRITTFFRAIIVYVRLLFFPAGLHMEREIQPLPFGSGEVLFATSVVAILIFLGYKLYSKDRTSSFAITWFLAMLLPVSNIVPINSFLAEHWLYMASVGFFMLIGIMAPRAYRQLCRFPIYARAVYAAILLGVCAALFSVTVLRNREWRDEFTFYESTLRYQPGSSRIHLHLGNAYFRKGRLDKAIEQYHEVLRLRSDDPAAYVNLGNAYLNKAQYGKAERYLSRALELQPRNPVAYFNLGIVYYQRAEYQQAIDSLERAVAQMPQHYEAWGMLGRTYNVTGETRKALEALERSLGIMPDQPQIRQLYRRIQSEAR